MCQCFSITYRRSAIDHPLRALGRGGRRSGDGKRGSPPPFGLPFVRSAARIGVSRDLPGRESALRMPERRPRHVLGARVNRLPSIEGTERQTGPQLARRTASTSSEAPRCAVVGRVCPRTRIGRSFLLLGTRAKIFDGAAPATTQARRSDSQRYRIHLRHLQGPVHTCSTSRQGTRLWDSLLLPSPRWSDQGILPFYDICR
jgi:hypothetical protein